MNRGRAKRVLQIVLVVALSAMGVGSAAAQAAKIGLVDLQKVLVDSKKGKGIVSKLQGDKDAKQKDVEAQEKKIRQMDADLEKQRTVLSESARTERERALRKAKTDLRRTVDDLNREFADRERDMRERLVRDVTAVVRAYGQKNGYVLIMEVRAGGVMFGSDQADLTKEITAAYDSSPGSEKK